MSANKLPTRTLGKDGPQVTALGFGSMGLSFLYGPTASDEDRLAFLDHVYESGQRHWDTSDLYGDSEELLGKWFARSGKRAEIFLATKFGCVPTNPREIRSDPEYVQQAVERSLGRLGVETIDLYYVHRVDQKTPIEHTIKALVDLKDQGKIRYIGLSEVSAETLRRAYKVHPIQAVQIEYSPFTLDIEKPETGLLEAARELGVTIVAYSPLGRGMLTGKYTSPNDFDQRDYRRYLPRFSADNFPKNLQLVEKLKKIAAEKDIPVSTLILAWLLAQGDDIIPIPGASKAMNLDENQQALNVELSPDVVSQIRLLVDKADVAGTRYDVNTLKTCFADTPSL